jgi:integrase
MAPRPRQHARPLPGGIKPEALPDYVYWDPSGRGRWIVKHYDPQTKRTTSHRLAGPTATLRDIWDAYENARRAPPADTVGKLIERFEASPQWADLAATTRRDYHSCAAALASARTKAGALVADTRLSDWTPGAVRSYCERRAETSRSRANHELRYLRRLFSWAVERDLMPTNPARGVRALKEDPRQRYVSDGEYTAFLRHAGARHPYLVPVAELAYLCRLRISEVCDLRRTDVRDDGLFGARRKGSKDALTGWTPRLRAAIDCALALHGDIKSLYIIPGPSRGRMSESTIQTAWQRCMVEWAALGNERFTVHDLKRKGVSDAAGDKLAASGHRSMAMLRVYDVLPSKAPATR